MGGSRTDRLSRTARPTALLSAVATLLGALFICLGPAGTHHGKPSPRAHGPGATAAAEAGTAPARTATAYSCPYDDGGCGLLPVLSPAVLTVPPPQLDAPLEAGAALPHPGPAADAGGRGRSGVLARAPDLHVLQVLRT